MKQLLVLLFLLITFNSFAQDWPVKQKVLDAKAKQVNFTRYQPFTFRSDKRLGQRGLYQELRINSSFTSEIMRQRPAAIQLSVPVSNNETVTCELVKFDLGNTRVLENNDKQIEGLKIPVLYRGVITSEQGKNNVMLTVTDDDLTMTAITGNRSFQIVKTEHDNGSSYRLYNSQRINFPTGNIDCGTKDIGASQTADGIALNGQARPANAIDKCVYVFVDCFNNVYLWKNQSTQATINYVYNLYNTVATGYLNEQINIYITDINVWTTADPYRKTNRDTALTDLAKFRRDSFWGNICVGLDHSDTTTLGRSGLAGDIGRIKGVGIDICPKYVSGIVSACCYIDLNYNVTVQDFPVGSGVTQQQAYLTMHEMGHLLGARHTKWCGWKLTSNPDTFGAIDSCGPHTEGSCIGPPPPSNGATIMSYCVLNNANGLFVSFNNGFGPLPGNALRNFVDQNPCIPTCVYCTTLVLPQHDHEKDKHPENNLSGLVLKQPDEATEQLSLQQKLPIQ